MAHGKLIRTILVSFMASTAWLPAHAETVCSKPIAGMASHETTPHLFESVVVGIHGWNGACNSTFGKGKSNMLKLLKVNGSFDVDCFEYDSRNGTIDNARACLKDRLQILRQEGYSEVALITHSTGGVVALELVVNEASNGSSSFLFDPDDGLKLRGLYAWAAPINGVRAKISFAGRFAKFWQWLNGSHEKILPELESGSPYLEDLHNRLRAFDDGMADPAKKAQHSFAIRFLQGNEDDWVVRNVKPDDAWFLRNLGAKLIETDMGHLSNVRNPGVEEALKFPAATQLDSVNLVFGLFPRFDDYFVSTAPATKEAETRRQSIVEGVANYLEEPSLFQNGRKAIAELIARVFGGGYRRSESHDEYVAKRITGLLAGWFQSQNREVALSAANGLLAETEKQLGHLGSSEVTRFGGGSRRALRNFVCDLKVVFEKVAGRNGLIRQASLSPTENQEALQFQKHMTTVMLSLMSYIDEDPRGFGCVREFIREASSSADVEVIRATEFIDVLRDYMDKNNDVLTSTAKRQLAQGFEQLALRSDLTEETLARLNSKTNWLGRPDAPLWSSFFTDAQVTHLSKKLVKEQPALLENISEDTPFFDFAGAVIERVGSTGTRPRVSIDLGRAIISASENLDEPVRARIFEKTLQASQKAPYPSIERALRFQLQAPY